MKLQLCLWGSASCFPSTHPNGYLLAFLSRGKMWISVTYLLLASLLSLSNRATARLPDGRLSANLPPLSVVPPVAVPDSGPVRDSDGNQIPPYETVYYFDQLIDHSDPSKGTFKARYWATWEFYDPGGPVILMTPGEVNADGTSQPCSILEPTKDPQ